MLLETIKENKIKTWQYMERYVNRGSESGFDKINNTIPQFTNPYSDTKEYVLNVYDCSNVEKEIILSNGAADIIDPNEFILHPGNEILSEKNAPLKQVISNLSKINDNRFTASPTSSSRTVFLNKAGQCIGFLKLHYDELIGRVNRAISKKQALSSIELTELITKAFKKKLLPENLYFFKESVAKVLSLNNYEMSYVFRELEPFPNNSNIKYIVPIFSLFSKDKFSIKDKTLLQQLFEVQSKSLAQFLLYDLILPIFTCYFELIINLGLQPEWQAQNVLIGLDEHFKIIGIIFRDLESIDRDIELMKDLDFFSNSEYPFFASYDYKCIWKNYRPLTKNSYQIKHSFMFDFKLCRYLILPLIEHAKTFGTIDTEKIAIEIKEFNQQYIKKLPVDFFPKDCWYNYANIVLDRSKPRPFVLNYDVLFR